MAQCNLDESRQDEAVEIFQKHFYRLYNNQPQLGFDIMPSDRQMDQMNLERILATSNEAMQRTIAEFNKKQQS